MTARLALCLLLGVWLAGCRLWAGSPVLPEQAPQRPPNFILILLDDLGVQDLGVNGNTFIETPAIDALAGDGIRFSQAYANAPNCAPSRAALMSGQYATRTGVYTMMKGDMGLASRRKLLVPPNRVYLPERVYTLAEALRDRGYATAHIGKWNLGTGPVRGPLGQGFDINIGGYRGGAEHYQAPYHKDLPGLQQAPPGEYLTDRLNAEALKFIDQQGDRPFFLYLAHFAPHFPIQAPAPTRDKYRQKRDALCAESDHDFCDPTSFYPEYAAMIEHVDQGLAQLRALLARKGLADDTVIVLASDNGAYAWSTEWQAFRGSKSQLYEGGIRVPMIWHVPGSRLAGQSQSLPVTLMDIYPTFISMAGGSAMGMQLDGHDLGPLLGKRAGDASVFRQRPLFWYLPGYTIDSETRPENMAQEEEDKPFYQVPAAVVRQGDWKLIRYYDDTPAELYDLSRDPLEQYNVFLDASAHAQGLMATLEGWLRETGGVLSLQPNPDYAPGQ